MDELDGIESLSRSIMQWGPAAIAMILMFIAERKLKERWGNSTGSDHAIFTRLYVSNWLFIAGMLIIVTYFWIQKESNAHRAINTQGYISYAPENIRLYSRNDFYQRLSSKGTTFNRYNEIAWHFTNDTPTDKTLFSVQGADGLTVKEYYISPELDYADSSNIELRYTSNDQGYNLEYRAAGNRFKTLKPIPSAADDPIARHSSPQPVAENVINFFFTGAHANDVNFSDIKKALSSNNPFTRQEAAAYLAEHRNVYFDDIENSLQKADISDKQLWGILLALGETSMNHPEEQEARQLSPEAQKTVFNALFHSSPTIDLQARKLFLKTLNNSYLAMYQEKCGDIDAIDDAFIKERCSYIGMSVYYNVAIIRAVSNGNATVDDIIKAIQQMRTARELWNYAPVEKQIHHGKLRYGVGLLFEKLAEAYEQINKSEDAAKARNNSVSGFTDFLDFLKKHSSESEVYPYCWHIDQAKCYTQNPTVSCISDNPVRECDYVAIATQETVQADTQSSGKTEAVDIEKP